jgi:ketosteroid isomerase-like protein
LKSHFLIGAMLVVFGLFLIPTIAGADSTDPVALYRQYADDQNRGDVTAQVALLADDIVLHVDVPCCSQVVGKANMQKTIEGRIAAHTQVVILNITGSGDMMTARQEARSDTVKAAGVDRIIVTSNCELRNRQLALCHNTYETSDPQTAKYVAFLTAKAAPASVTQLPRTGGFPVAPPILFAGSALLVGLAIRRFVRQRSD